MLDKSGKENCLAEDFYQCLVCLKS